MTQDPYRPRQGGPSDELGKLAERGHARMQAEQGARQHDQSAVANRNMRIAIGAVRGSPMKLAIVGTTLSCGLLLLALDLFPRFQTLTPLGTAGLMLTLGVIPIAFYIPPVATNAAVEAERAWVASLPYALESYFDLLASRPEARFRLRVEIWWRGPGVDGDTLQGVLAMFDAEARLIQVEPRFASLTTGPILGRVGPRRSSGVAFRNGGIAKSVHRLVDVALAPIHRSSPIERVAVSRTY